MFWFKGISLKLYIVLHHDVLCKMQTKIIKKKPQRTYSTAHKIKAVRKVFSEIRNNPKLIKEIDKTLLH